MAISKLVEMQQKAHSKRIPNEYVDEVDRVCKKCRKRSACEFQDDLCSYRCVIKIKVDVDLQKNLYQRVVNLISSLGTQDLKSTKDDLRKVIEQSQKNLH
jgi:hypothetical protein